MAPEYYASYDKDGNATVDWDALSDGATMHYGTGTWIRRLPPSPT